MKLGLIARRRRLLKASLIVFLATASLAADLPNLSILPSPDSRVFNPPLVHAIVGPPCTKCWTETTNHSETCKLYECCGDCHCVKTEMKWIERRCCRCNGAKFCKFPKWRSTTRFYRNPCN